MLDLPALPREINYHTLSLEQTRQHLKPERENHKHMYLQAKGLPRRRLALNEVKGLLPANAVDSTVLIPKENTIAFVGNMDDFRSEGRTDELRASLLGDRLKQSGNGCTVLGV